MYGHGRQAVVCVVNGEVFRVRRLQDCYSGQVYVRRAPRQRVIVDAPRPRVVVQRRRAYQGYSGVVTGYVGSPAAVAQAQRRAAKNGGEGFWYEGGLGHGSGGSFSGNGYGEGTYVETRRVVTRKRKARKARRVVYAPAYDPGLVYHTGPIITKDGGY
jgi:hypothetical protein